MSYIYAPLEAPEAEIRIAVLQPGTYDDDLRISFRTRLLADEQPLYEALSYCWGSEDDPSVVHVQNDDGSYATVHVTQNLDVALRHFRLQDEERLLWIDALCIDQGSNDERSKQVSRMGSIYSRAHVVLIWIGQEADESEKALDFLERVADNVEVDFATQYARPSQSSNDSSWADYTAPVPCQPGGIAPVVALLRRSYFHRSWIRQETANARRGEMYCGFRMLSFHKFRKSICALTHRTFYRTALGSETSESWIIMSENASQVCLASSTHYEYNVLRWWTGFTKCKDPRDKIFACLSLLSPRCVSIGITVDYSRSVEAIYTETALKIIHHTLDLNILRECELSSRKLSIPSWVPDWSCTTNTMDYTFSIRSACAWISALVLVPKDASNLHVKGILVAQVEHVNPLDVQSNIRSISTCLEELRDSQQIAMRLLIARQDTIQRCVRVLMEGHLRGDVPSRPDTSPPRAVCEALLDWVWGDQQEELTEEMEDHMFWFLGYIKERLTGRCYFHTTNSGMGVAPKETKPGDVLAIIFGCDSPLILRPSFQGTANEVWEVVGMCFADSLVRGEAVYGDIPPDIDFDIQEARFITSPVGYLEEKGIKVTNFQEEDRRIEVLPSSLIEAGIDVKDFVLI